VDRLQECRSERFAPAATAERAQKETQEAQALVRTICERSATILQEGPSLSPSVPTAFVFPRLSDLAGRVMVESALLDGKVFLESRLQPAGLPHTFHPVGINPTDEEIRSATAAMESAEQALLFVADAHIDAGMRVLLEAAQKSAKRLAVVLLRDVYDAELVRPGVLCVTNYGFRVCDIEAVLRKIFKS